MVQVRLSDEGDRHRWNEFVDGQSARAFCRFEWKNVLERTYGAEARFLMAQSPSGEIRGILPCYVNRSLRGRRQFFGIRRGLVASDNEVGEALLAAAAAQSTELGAAGFLVSSDQPWQNRFSSETRKSVALRLRENEEATWTALRRETRVGIKRSRKHETICEWGAQNLGAFYEIYADNMLGKNVPIFSIDYFRNLLSYLGENAGLVVVRYDHRIIAGMVVLWSGNTADLYIGAWLRPFAKQVPYQRMYWDAIAEAQSRGLAWVDMGESSEGSGTFKFKTNFGGEARDIYYFGPTKAGEDDEEGSFEDPGGKSLSRRVVGLVYAGLDRTPKPIKKRYSIWRRAHGRLA